VRVARVATFGIGVQCGGKLHLELIRHLRPIADNRYEGRAKWTLERERERERELQVPEITVGEVHCAAISDEVARQRVDLLSLRTRESSAPCPLYAPPVAPTD
jgi:hypothetical protein